MKGQQARFDAGARSATPQEFEAGEQPSAATGQAAELRGLAESGMTGADQPLPHLQAIQRSFGHHDVSGVRAYANDAASSAAAEMNAHGYALGDAVAFAGQPSLHTAAHEAAHVVQQRDGVHLQSAAHRSDDPHERAADAVADRVVQGRSAVDLLDAMHRAPTTVQRQSKAEAASTRSPEKTEKTEKETEASDPTTLQDVFDSIQKSLEFQTKLRLKAIEEVEQDAQVKASPKLDAVLLTALAEIALSAGAAGIGRSVIEFIPSFNDAAKASQDVINKVMQEGLKTFVKANVKQAASGNMKHGALRGFFRGQWGSLAHQENAGIKAFIKHGRAHLRGAKDGVRQAKAQDAALEKAQTQVQGIQRRATLQQWLVYVARMGNGTTKSGGTNVGHGLGDTSRKGVLGLEVKQAKAGGPITILDAEMDGISDGIAEEIAEIPIGKLQIPISVKGPVQHGDTGTAICFGFSEKGEHWDNSQSMGWDWLRARATAGRKRSEVRDYADIHRWSKPGAQAVMRDDLNAKSLKSVGVKVQTEGGVLD